MFKTKESRRKEPTLTHTSGSLKKLSNKLFNSKSTNDFFNQNSTRTKHSLSISKSTNPFINNIHPNYSHASNDTSRSSSRSSTRLSSISANRKNSSTNHSNTSHNSLTPSINIIGNANFSKNRSSSIRRTIQRSDSSASLSNKHLLYSSSTSSLNAPKSLSLSSSAPHSKDLSFYMHDGKSSSRVLPTPVANPNDFLPEDIKQSSVQFFDNFVFDDNRTQLGEGGSCVVNIVKSTHRKKDVYALKKLIMIYNETPEKFYERCSKEFIIAKRLSKNIHIANTFLLLRLPSATYCTRGWGFIMELCVGDLFSLIERSSWKNVPTSEKYCIFKQIAEGIKFCHDNGIAHRDLKPENVLISKDGICKLTDFGISDWFHEDPDDFDSPEKVCKGMIGSPPYAPPEVMYWDSKKHYSEELKQPYKPRGLDTYALGIILMTMIQNVIPFLDSCDKDLKFSQFLISYADYSKYSNKRFREKGNYKPGPGHEYSFSRCFNNRDASRVSWRLMDPNPETRYTIEDLFNDPWFQSIDVCVNFDDEYEIKAPQILKCTPPDASTESFHSSFEEKPKFRSMLDIALSPNLKGAEGENLSTYSADMLSACSDQQSSETFISATVLSDDASPKEEIVKNTLKKRHSLKKLVIADELFTVNENKVLEEKGVDSDEDKSTTSPLDDHLMKDSIIDDENLTSRTTPLEFESKSEIPRMLNKKMSTASIDSHLMTTINAADLHTEMFPKKKVKKVIHHHLSVLQNMG